MSGEEFNINSTKQLQIVLFEKMGIKPIKKTKTGYSTNMTVLQKLAEKHVIANTLVRYRILNKLRTTYLDSLPKLIHSQTKRIHTNYNQSVAATGRLSSNNPNLQNIPIKDKEGFLIRECFVAPAEHVIASFDYSQVELRILAKLSADKNLLQSYKDKKDIHRKTAELIYQTTDIDEAKRRVAKTINFSVMYGISSFALSERLKISNKEAGYFIESYFKAYPQVKNYIEEMIELSRKRKYTVTFYGRKRYAPDILSENMTVRNRAERMAFNSIIQGTASDIIKLSMIEIHRQIELGKIKAEMIMQVHDELVFYIHKENVKEASKKIIQAMTNISPFDDILEVEYSWGEKWNK